MDLKKGASRLDNKRSKICREAIKKDVKSIGKCVMQDSLRIRQHLLSPVVITSHSTETFNFILLSLNVRLFELSNLAVKKTTTTLYI